MALIWRRSSESLNEVSFYLPLIFSGSIFRTPRSSSSQIYHQLLKCSDVQLNTRANCGIESPLDGKCQNATKSVALKCFNCVNTFQNLCVLNAFLWHSLKVSLAISKIRLHCKCLVLTKMYHVTQINLSFLDLFVKWK